jgi:hypothetical protein
MAKNTDKRKCVRGRLTRLDFLYERWPIYFVTACTANHRQLLKSTAAHLEFTKFAASAVEHGAWGRSLCIDARSLSLVCSVR